MKLTKVFFIFAVLYSVLMVGCSPESILPSRKGKWDVKLETTTTTTSSSNTTTETYTATFQDDGTSVWVDKDGNSSNVKWSYNSDKEQVTLTYNIPIIGDKDFVFDVTKKALNTEKWERSYKDILNQDVKEVYTLTKAK